MLPQATATAAGRSRPIVARYRRCRARLLHQVGKQAEKTRPLDRPRQLALLLGRYRGDAARHDLAALRDEALQEPHVLVIDLRRIGPRERAGFAPAKERPARRRGAAVAAPLTSPVAAPGSARPACGLAFHLRLHLFGRFGRGGGGSRRGGWRRVPASPVV